MNEIIDNPEATYTLLLGIGSTLCLILSDATQFRPGRLLFKPLAALSFVYLAWALSATDTVYGRWLLAGLLTCMVGDLCLMQEGQAAFLAGLSAFLCGHLLYVMAFMHLGFNAVALLVGSVPALILLFLSTRWLRPHLPPAMKLPVYAYILVITAMLLAACLTTHNSAGLVILTGAWGFAISDLAVARQQFVKKTKLNGMWGTPLYFASQLLLAASVSFI
ncbi:MAG: putative membrane protein YhhN [Halieaceae bacterium]